MSVPGIISIYVLHAVSVVLLCRSRYSRKTTVIICGVIAALQIGFALGAVYYLRGAAWLYLVFTITLAITLAEVFILSSESFSKTFFLCLTYVQAFLVVTYLSGILTNWLFGGREGKMAYVRMVLHTALVMVYAVFFREKFEAIRREVTEGWWPMCLLSILYSLYISYVVVKALADNFREVEILPFLLLLAVILAGYWVIFRTVHYMREAVLSGKIEQQNRILKEKLDIMEEAERENRRARHDFRHHMRNLAEYARNGKMEELLEYLEKYCVEVEKASPLLLCANSTINHILTVYASQAEKRGILVNCDIRVEEEIGIDEVDLVAILGNLLENAVHGCLEAKKEQTDLLVRIRSKAGKLSILVENTCRENIFFEDGLPRAKGREGIGASSVVRSVEKYGGEADFRCLEGRFASRVVISMGKTG